MDCVKLYFKDKLVGILTFDAKKEEYLFVKNKFFNNKYINEIIGLNEIDEIYYSPTLFSFFNTFLLRYGNIKNENNYEELIQIANQNFDKNQFWIGV